MEYGIENVPQARVPDVHRDTLGRSAVVNADILAGAATDLLDEQRATEQAQFETGGFRFGTETDTVEASRGVISVEVGSFQVIKNGRPYEGFGDHIRDKEGAQQALETDTQEVCQQLAGFTTAQQALLEAYANSSAPDSLKAAKNKGHEPDAAPSWQTWLSRIASPDQLIGFLRWHVAMVEQQQTDPDVHAIIEEERRQHKESIAVAVAEGWLHESALAAVDKLDHITAYIGDIFSTHIRENLGYYQQGIDEIVIAGGRYPGYPEFCKADLLYNARRSARHEFTHAEVGWWAARWINEAFAEHTTQSLADGDWHIVEPAQRPNPDGLFIYISERSLLSGLLNGGRHEVPVRLGTRAFSEREPSIEARADFGHALDEAWGGFGLRNSHGALQNMNVYVATLEQAYQRLGATPRQAGNLASDQALQDLVKTPKVIFGSNPTRARARQEFLLRS